MLTKLKLSSARRNSQAHWRITATFTVILEEVLGNCEAEKK